MPQRWSQSSRNVSNAVTRQPHEQRHPEQQLQRDDRPQHLGQVGRRDRDLGQHPEHDVDPRRILGPAGLRQVVPGHHPQPRRQGLQAARPSGSTSAGPRSARSRTGRPPPGRSPSCPGPCSRRSPGTPAPGTRRAGAAFATVLRGGTSIEPWTSSSDRRSGRVSSTTAMPLLVPLYHESPYSDISHSFASGTWLHHFEAPDKRVSKNPKDYFLVIQNIGEKLSGRASFV